MKAIGLVELPNCTDAIQALDVMLKTADVQFLTWEKKLGGRLVTLIVQGNVAAVTEAVEAAKHRAVGRVVASTVIANPHEETWKLIEVSRRKYPYLRDLNDTSVLQTGVKGGNKNVTSGIRYDRNDRTGSFYRGCRRYAESR